MKQTHSVYIGVPYTRPFYGSFIDCLLTCHKPDEVWWNRIPGLAVDVARNELVKDFLERGEYDYLLFIDNDATWADDAIMRLLAHDLPMVCGTFFTRGYPPKPTIGKFVGITGEGKRIYRYAETGRNIVKFARENGLTAETAKNAMCIGDGARNAESGARNADNGSRHAVTLHQVDGCGMHFTAIRRDVFKKLSAPFFIMNGMTGAGEDFYFCEKVREAGFPIYVDLSVAVGHAAGEEVDFGLREFLYYTEHVLNPDEDILDGDGGWILEDPLGAIPQSQNRIFREEPG